MSKSQPQRIQTGQDNNQARETITINKNVLILIISLVTLLKGEEALILVRIKQ
jgi:hypothetical protein